MQAGSKSEVFKLQHGVTHDLKYMLNLPLDVCVGECVCALLAAVCEEREMKGPFVTRRSALLTSRCVSRVRAQLSHSLSVHSQPKTLRQQSKCATAEQAGVLLWQRIKAKATAGVQKSYSHLILLL